MLPFKLARLVMRGRSVVSRVRTITNAHTASEKANAVCRESDLSGMVLASHSLTLSGRNRMLIFESHVDLQTDTKIQE